MYERTAEVHSLGDDGQYRPGGTYGENEALQSSLLEGLRIDLSSVFAYS